LASRERETHIERKSKNPFSLVFRKRETHIQEIPESYDVAYKHND